MQSHLLQAHNLVAPVIAEMSKQMGRHSDDEDVATMIEAMLRDLLTIKLVQFTRRAFSEAQVEALVEKANQYDSRT